MARAECWFYPLEERCRLLGHIVPQSMRTRSMGRIRPESTSFSIWHLNQDIGNLWGQHFIQFRLGKLYTEDGLSVIEGNRAGRLDVHFRNPAFDRSETRQRKLEKTCQIHISFEHSRLSKLGTSLKVRRPSQDAYELDSRRSSAGPR